MDDNERARIIEAIQDVAEEPLSDAPTGDERADAALQWLRNERRVSREKAERAASV